MRLILAEVRSVEDFTRAMQSASPALRQRWYIEAFERQGYERIQSEEAGK